MVFQDPYASLDPFHSVEWHIKRPLIISKYRGNIEDRVDELLEMVKLNPPAYFKNKYPNQISGGQRQRVYIARVLALNPKIIIADEPVSMLDVSLRIEILDLFSRIRDNFGISIVYITHDLNTVSMITDRIYVLKDGVVVEKGDTEEILKNPREDYTRKLIEAAPDPYKRL
jgi:peptide/nickel transport system ATP-binding protein